MNSPFNSKFINAPGAAAGELPRPAESSQIAVAPQGSDSTTNGDGDLSAGAVDAFRLGLDLDAGLEALRPLLRRADRNPVERRQLGLILGAAIASLDVTINRFVNEVLHHPQFQKLESAWRGLRYLVESSEPEEGVKIRVLNVRKDELRADLENAIEFDQSAIFHKVYEEEFGLAGGEPFGMLIGDYEISPQPRDIDLLEKMSGVAAAAFAPFIAAADPRLLAIEDFSVLERKLNLSSIFQLPDYVRWRAFCASPDARFIGLALPRVLLRLPYHRNRCGMGRFPFREDVEEPNVQGYPDRYLWGNAAYAMGAVVIRSFSQSKWFTDIRGVRKGEEGAGLVVGLPAYHFDTDSPGIASQAPTDCFISDPLGNELSDLGFIPLVRCKDSEFCAFYGNSSLQQFGLQSGATPRAAATFQNARISAMLQYVWCASRIAHYVKSIGRDVIGSLNDPADIREILIKWLSKYTVDDADASIEVKARFPLRSFEVNLREDPKSPGSYFCEMLLVPHSQRDELVSGVKLTAELKDVSARAV